MIKVYFVEWRKSLPKTATFPCFKLEGDSWNDYGYRTLFTLSFHEKKGNSIEIGHVKILHRNTTQTAIPASFAHLSKSFSSLGQEISFYETLVNKLEERPRKFILRALNDVVAYPDVLEKFRDEEGFKVSLLRTSGAEKALSEGSKVLNFQERRGTDFLFTFSCRLDGAKSDHELNFDFMRYDSLPNRITALVGKNGTGKTQLLSRIAHVLSGQKKELGTFHPERPRFDKVIAISYSAFDSFDRPSSTEQFLYRYSGLRSGNKLLNAESLLKQIQASLSRVLKLSRSQTWMKLVSSLIGARNLPVEFIDPAEGENHVTTLETRVRKLSSGQMLILTVMTDIIADIQNESLILFDEPEMHLHPNAIAVMMKYLNWLLEDFNSYAIVSTHSPIILQEIPSRSVIMLDREGNVPIVSELIPECFGENIATITNEVFRVTDEESSYKQSLIKLAQDLDYEEVLRLFEGKLSLNARVYLKSLYQQHETKL